MKQQLTSALLFGALFGALMLALPAEEAHCAKKRFEFGGRLGLGGGADDNGDRGNLFEARLEARSPRKKGVKGVFELRADEDSRSVSINDAFLDYRGKSKSFNIRAGRGKKTLGWEYEYPASTRLSLHRTATYQYLAERSWVGRDYFVSYEWVDRLPSEEIEEGADEASPDPTPFTSGQSTDNTLLDPAVPMELIDPELRWKLSASVYTNETEYATLILSALRTLSPNWRVGTWGALMRYAGPGAAYPVYSGVASVLYREGLQRGSLEAFFGVDPYRTEIERDFGAGRTIRFASLKAEYGMYLGQWNPYLAGTHLWKDLAHGEDRLVEALLGLRYYFTSALNLAVEGGLNSSRVAVDPTSVPFNRKSFTLLMRYFF